MKKIVIIGSSGLSERLIHYFESTGFAEVNGLFDDFEPSGIIKYGKQILGKIEEIVPIYNKGTFDAIVIGIGYKHMHFRKTVYEYLKRNQIPLATFIHPGAHVDPTASIKEGSIVLFNSVVDFHATLHENVFLSPNCYVSHHVNIYGHTYCAPCVKLAGYSTIGQMCFLGIDTTTIDHIDIGANVKTAAGAVVTQNVPSNTLVAGVPAVVKKTLLPS